MDEQSPHSTAKPGRRSERPEVGKDEDFAAPDPGRMQLWLTAVTVVAALAVLAVVSMAVMHVG